MVHPLHAVKQGAAVSAQGQTFKFILSDIVVKFCSCLRQKYKPDTGQANKPFSKTYKNVTWLSVDLNGNVHVDNSSIGITAQQELMRRGTDGAACLCQHSGWRRSVRDPSEHRWGVRIQCVEWKCQTVIWKSLFSTQTALHLSRALYWCPLPLPPVHPTNTHLKKKQKNFKWITGWSNIFTATS